MIKEYCLNTFENVEPHIFKYIEEYEKDNLVLIEVEKDSIMFEMIINKDLVEIFEEVEDYVYKIKIINNFEKKMYYLENEMYFEKNDIIFVNKFLTSMSLILLHEDNINFMKFLQKNAEPDKFIQLLQYAFIHSSGWIKPKFYCVPILLNDF